MMHSLARSLGRGSILTRRVICRRVICRPGICRTLIFASLTLGLFGCGSTEGCSEAAETAQCSDVGATGADAELALEAEVEIDPEVTPERFVEWRSPRFGSTNPQRMNNPVWEWLVRSRIDAYQATVALGGPSALDAGPGWSFDRFGQSETQLPDGRTVWVAGEHEDHYDADFYIYNDVVIQHPDGRLELFGYPEDAFPPTDFHSATLVGDRIWLVGNLGHREWRRYDTTQVLVLDLATWRIEAVATSGDSPGWLHGHEATLTNDETAILVRGGKLDRGPDSRSLVENIDDWRLDLASKRWTRLTERNWPRFEVHRSDGAMLHLTEYMIAEFEESVERSGMDELAEGLSEAAGGDSLEATLGTAPDVELYRRRFEPPIPHEKLPGLLDPIAEDALMVDTAAYDAPVDEFQTQRIRIDGVVVRYVEQLHEVQLTVEGELPAGVVEALTRDLLQKLSRLENSPCELSRLGAL